MNRLRNMIYAPERLVALLATVIALYHLINIAALISGETQHKIIHLGSIMIFITVSRLLVPEEGKGRLYRGFLFLFLLTALISVLYMYIDYERLEGTFGFLTNLDLVIGILLVVAVGGITWFIWGPVLPLLTLVAILYFAFGHLLPGQLAAVSNSPEFIVSYLGIGINAGITGYLLPISANYTFLFLLFGGLLVCVKALDLMLEVGKAAGNLLRVGPAYTAVVASSLFGMTSGSAIGNVTFTGSFTIPSMKSRGYSPEQAAAIESAASTGGQITPPIMGASAFVMASFLGVAYIEIVKIAVLPAALYYLSVAVAVYLMCARAGIYCPHESVDKSLILRRLPVFVIPLVLILVLLFNRMSAMYAIFWVIIIMLGISMLQRDTRPSFRDLLGGFQKGVKMGSEVGILLALVGIIAQVMTVTGVGIKFSTVFADLAGGNILLLLFLGMVVSIILGIGVPTTAAYILVALTVVPSLLNLGVAEHAAHFFAFFFAVFSTLTPPVALTTIAASKLAGSRWGQTSIMGVKIAIAAWILPFIWVTHPELLELLSNPSIAVVPYILVSLMALMGLLIGIHGYWFKPLGRPERIVYLIAGGLFLVYLLQIENIFILGFAAILLLGFTVWDFISGKKLSTEIKTQ